MLRSGYWIVEFLSISRILRRAPALRDTDLNHRQIALLSHAMQHADAEYPFKSHQTSHPIAFQTARTDLLDREERGYLERIKRGKRFFFLPVPDLDRRIARFSAPS